jgi:hypothetical protein
VSGNRQAGQRGAAGRGGGASRGGGGAGRGGGSGAGRGGGSADRGGNGGGAGRGGSGTARGGGGAGRSAWARGTGGSATPGRPGAARGTGPARRPLPRGQALYTPGASAGRQAVERRSAALLVYLHQLPRWIPPVVLAALLIVGLTVAGIGGAVALAGVVLVLVWLAVVSWPSLTPAGRVVRALTIALVIGAAVVQVAR